MKSEAAVTAPRGGIVGRIAVAKVQQVEGGDLLVELGESR
ncbi:biotin/lipoyl-containing protein [Nocardia sp. NPDC055029]